MQSQKENIQDDYNFFEWGTTESGFKRAKLYSQFPRDLFAVRIVPAMYELSLSEEMDGGERVITYKLDYYGLGCFSDFLGVPAEYKCGILGNADEVFYQSDFKSFKAFAEAKSQEVISICCPDIKVFTDEQKRWIDVGEKVGLSSEQINTYADMRFSPEQMFEIYKAYHFTELNDKSVKIFASPEFNKYQMRVLCAEMRGFDNKLGKLRCLTFKEVSAIADPKFSADQMSGIADALRDGWDIRHIDMFANTEINSNMIKKFNAEHKNGSSYRQIKKEINAYLSRKNENINLKEIPVIAEEEKCAKEYKGAKKQEEEECTQCYEYSDIER